MANLFKRCIFILSFQLQLLIKRVLSLSVTSPLMKILTGVELLLRKAQVGHQTELL